MGEQLELFSIPSPCRRICTSNNKGYCKGCMRSRDERLYWNQMNNSQRRKVLALCKRRALSYYRAMRHKKEYQQLPLFQLKQGNLFDND